MNDVHLETPPVQESAASLDGSENGGKGASLLADIPLELDAKIRQDEWAKESFVLLPAEVRGSLVELWREKQGASQDEELRCALRIRALLREYFDGGATLVQIFSGKTNGELDRSMADLSGDDLDLLSKDEEQLYAGLTERIEREEDGEMKQRLIVACIRLTHKMGVNSVGLKGQYGLMQGWPAVRKQYLPYTTAKLVSGEPLAAAVEAMGPEDEVLEDASDVAEEVRQTLEVDEAEDRHLDDGETAGGGTDVLEGGDLGEESEGKDPLPPAVRAQFERVFEQYQAAHGKPDGFLQAPAKMKLVEMFALFREYSHLVGEIGNRTGRGRGQILKYAKRLERDLGLTPLSDEEKRAIERLKGKLTVTADRGGKFIPKDQKKILIGLIRLLRKGNHDEELEALLADLDVRNSFRWFMEKKYATVMTRDLIPFAFEEERPPEAPADTTASVAEDADASQGTSRGDAEPPALTEPSADSVVDIPRTAPPVAKVVHASTLDRDRLVLVEELQKGQNRVLELFASLPREKQDPAILSGIVQTNLAITRLIEGDGARPTSVEEFPDRLPDITLVKRPGPSVPREVPAPVSVLTPGMTYQTKAGGMVTVSSGVQGVVIVLEGENPSEQ